MITSSLVANWRLVLLGMLMSTMTTVCFYMVTAYTPTFGSTVLHLAATGNLVVTLCVGGPELCAAAGIGRPFGPRRPPSRTFGLHGGGARDSLPGFIVAGRRSFLRAAPRRRAMAGSNLCHLQRGHGRLSHGNYAG